MGHRCRRNSGWRYDHWLLCEKLVHLHPKPLDISATMEDREVQPQDAKQSLGSNSTKEVITTYPKSSYALSFLDKLLLVM